jgi:parvulin-like peptidyl-prolyl isomerase
VKKLLLSLVALVLVASACGGGSSNAATVDGTNISRKDVIAVLDAASKDPSVRTEIAGGGDDAASTKPPKTYKSDVTATVVTNLLMFTIIDNELKANGITPTAIDSSEYDAYQAFTAKGDALQTDLAALTKKYAAKDWSDADVEAYRKAFSGQYEEACTHHILVATEDQAKTILGEINAGTKFADEVSKSIDTSSAAQGGDVGCNAREGTLVKEYTDAVAKAKDGDLIGPIKSEFGYHIIQVDKAFYARPMDETLKAEILTKLTDVNAQIQWLARKANVTVDKKIGTWDPITIQITPPAGATTTTKAPAATAGVPTTVPGAASTTAPTATTGPATSGPATTVVAGTTAR